jgi:four helix bundle protein
VNLPITHKTLVMNVLNENIVVTKSFKFALKIVKYCEVLELKRKFVVSNQLLKSGTSIGANIHEAQNAESKADFIHKMKIAAKEIDETKYWLMICKESENYPSVDQELDDVLELARIVNKIVSSSKKVN